MSYNFRFFSKKMVPFSFRFFLFFTEASLFILIMNVSLFSVIVILSLCSSNVVILAPDDYPV